MSEVPQRRVLVVDDQPLVRDALKMLLAFESYAVEIANGSKEALGLFQRGIRDGGTGRTSSARNRLLRLP